MSQDRETNLALFIDFDNVAIGARDSGQRFEIKLLLQRLLEKGKIIAKKAYADWHYYKEYMAPLHEAAIELIEIPMPKISGKNSADIKLVVDAMDLCYSKDHIDTFVIVSGDSDFSPLVSKLRENNKRVIGVGVKNSSSRLLIGNCDEFIFYDDIYRQRSGRLSRSGVKVPDGKRELFDFLIKTVQSLLLESRGVLYSSLIKDTMTRKQPDFNERNHGYSTFGDLLEEARELGLLKVDRDAQAGGTWVVKGLGEGIALEKAGFASAPKVGTRGRIAGPQGCRGDRDPIGDRGKDGPVATEGGREADRESGGAQAGDEAPGKTKRETKREIQRGAGDQKGSGQKSAGQKDHHQEGGRQKTGGHKGADQKDGQEGNEKNLQSADEKNREEKHEKSGLKTCQRQKDIQEEMTWRQAVECRSRTGKIRWVCGY